MVGGDGWHVAEHVVGSMALCDFVYTWFWSVECDGVTSCRVVPTFSCQDFCKRGMHVVGMMQGIVW